MHTHHNSGLMSVIKINNNTLKTHMTRAPNLTSTTQITTHLGLASTTHPCGVARPCRHTGTPLTASINLLIRASLFFGRLANTSLAALFFLGLASTTHPCGVASPCRHTGTPLTATINLHRYTCAPRTAPTCFRFVGHVDEVGL
eukprot:GHVN01106677.1.p1 GENE.GHVN01106677.1~~GHVN01106677.1.p1  ORF type:complete len:144 (-),score=13.35 GHVN01106677.1:52-483(-)